MAARPRYPSAHEQLLVLALEARASGASFDVFWKRALRPGRAPVTWAVPAEVRPAGCIVWPRDTKDRNVSRDVTCSREVREGWRRAYEGVPPTRADVALQALSPVFLPLEQVSLAVAV